MQGIGQGADMLAKDGPAAGDVLYPPSLIGLWRCERTVSSVEGDAQQACNQPATTCAPTMQPVPWTPGCNHKCTPACHRASQAEGAWRLLGGDGELRKPETYLLRYVPQVYLLWL